MSEHLGCFSHSYAENYNFNEGSASYDSIPEMTSRGRNYASLSGYNLFHSGKDYYTLLIDGKCYEYPIDRIFPEEMWVTQMAFSRRHDETSVWTE